MGQGHKDKHQDETLPPTQEQVEGSVAAGVAAGNLPPQSDEQKAGQALCGEAVRMLIGGHMTTVFLTDFDLSSNSYHGVAIRSFAMADEKVPVIEAVHGARPYPTTDRPNYAFQFVAPGDDESLLINIAHKNLVDRQPHETTD